MAGDRIGRSVPAPGQGVLTAAREDPRSASSPLLDLEYRRRHLEDDLAQIREWRKAQLRTAMSRGGKDVEAAVRSVEVAAATKTRAAQSMWSHELRRQDAGISPMKAALATWGLGVDDIQVASFHGTSTKANDKNESNVVNTQMAHLGRTPGNPLLVVCQKYLTGHPKGAAGAWMLNGCLQAMATGIVPGNRNADNVDDALRHFSHLVYPTQSVRVGPIKAFMLTSFGFGQKGGLVLGVAPRYLFAATDAKTYAAYRARCLARQSLAHHRLAEGLLSNDLFRAKTTPPWKPEDEAAVLLDPHARVALGADNTTYEFDGANLHPGDSDSESEAPLDSGYNSDNDLCDSLTAATHKLVGGAPAGPAATTVGIDVENVDGGVGTDNPVFLARNYTDAELAYCRSQPDVRASLVGRWAAKEAVFKSLNVASKGAAAAMKAIEVLSSDEGVPVVRLHGEAKEVAAREGVTEVRLSISHSESVAIAIALAAREGGRGDEFWCA